MSPLSQNVETQVRTSVEEVVAEKEIKVVDSKDKPALEKIGEKLISEQYRP